MKWIKPHIVDIEVASDGKISEAGSLVGVIILAVYGEGVTSHPLRENDTFVSRLELNDSLLWTAYKTHVCVLPSSTVKDLLEEKKSYYVASIVVGRAFAEMHEMALAKQEEFSNIRMLVSSKPLREFILELVYHKMLLPVLSFWMLVLVGNLILSSRISDRLSAEHRTKQQKEIHSRARIEANERQQKMIAEYEALMLPGCSAVIDRVAFLLPDGIQLTNIDYSNPRELLIKGDALELSQIMRFSELLKDACQHAEIQSVETHPRDPMFYFSLCVRP